jgi:hypothetical protein
MKKLLVVVAVLVCAFSLTASAGQGKHKLTPEQKALRKEILEKYDTNKDGKLNKKERAQISKEDRERLEKAGLGQKHKHASKETN